MVIMHIFVSLCVACWSYWVEIYQPQTLKQSLLALHPVHDGLMCTCMDGTPTCTHIKVFLAECALHSFAIAFSPLEACSH
jgi:hypothetical protein